MILTGAKLLPIHPYQFRCGQLAEIVGVKWVIPDGNTGRVCFHLRWEDGETDFLPISDSSNYIIIPDKWVYITEQAKEKAAE